MTNARHVPIGDIKPNPNNPRIIKDDKFRKLVKSIKDFPEMLALRPIVVNSEMVVLGGNMRLKACKEAGLKEVPVILASGLTDERQREFIIKDNVGFGEWEWETLANEWDADQLAEWGLDVPEFDKVIENGLTDPDDVPDVPVTPVTAIGDVWILGDHKVTCGDSTTSSAWDAVMAGEEADMVWTDPPYGVSYVGKTKDALTIDNDSLDADSLLMFLESVFGYALAFTKEGGAWYVAAPPGPLFGVFGKALTDNGVWKHTLVWVKDQFVMGRSDYHYRHEAIFYGWRPGAAHTWNSDRKQSTVLEFARPRRNAEHPTMKPVELIEYCILNSTNQDAIVLDCFGGSGSTLLAAQKTGRKARLIEFAPKYVDVIVKRWQDFTGRDAIHSVTGQTFNQMASSNERTPNG
jgi:site-specific DNA-methyltransferase (adenine-specific)